MTSVEMERVERVELDGATLSCLDVGVGEPAVALHCSASAGRQWKLLAEALEPTFRLVAPDLHGCGHSTGWPGHRPFRLADEAAAVHALVRRLGQPVHLIGHSYGGALALRAALEAPDEVMSLTLIEPSAFHLLRQDASDDAPRLWAEVHVLGDRVDQAVASGDYCFGMSRFIDYWNGDGSWDRLQERQKVALAAMAPRVLLDFRALFLETTPLPSYRRLGMPALIVQGTSSPAPSRRICSMLARTLPHALSVTIDEFGHMGAVNNPGRVNPLIADHLRSPVYQLSKAA